MKKLLGILVLGLLWCNVGVAQELIKIPVHVHIVDLSEIGINTKISESDIQKDFAETNEIWSQADIFWEIKSINRIKGNTETYIKERKWLKKKFIPYRVKGTNKKKYNLYGGKLQQNLLKVSKAKDFQMHTNRINIYYINDIVPDLKKGKSTYTYSGYTIRQTLIVAPTKKVQTMRAQRNSGFINVNTPSRTGLVYIAITKGEIDCESRSYTLAHELGHQFISGHPGEVGKHLMSTGCKQIGTASGYDILSGSILSKEDIDRSRRIYFKYFQKVLK